MEQKRIWNIRIRNGWGSVWIIAFIFDAYDIFGFLTMPDFTMECSDYYFCGQLDHFKGNTLFVLNWVHMKSVVLYHILYMSHTIGIIWLLESYMILSHHWKHIERTICDGNFQFRINDFRVRKFWFNCRFTKKTSYHQVQFLYSWQCSTMHAAKYHLQTVVVSSV